jgi:hypothetical protein
MVRSMCLRLVIVVFAVNVNEAAAHIMSRMRLRAQTMEESLASLDLRIQTIDEIMSSMTPVSAMRVLQHSNRTQPELLNLLQTNFGLTSSSRKSLRVVKPEQLWADGSEAVAAVQTAAHQPVKGYSALDKATDMLNAMAEETRANLEKEKFRCSTYDFKQLFLLDVTRTKVIEYNSDAAEARGRVIDSQGKISSFSENLKKTNEDFIEHKKQCKEDIKILKSQLKVVRSDIKVMARILELTKCSSLMLFQCRECGNAVMLQHDEMSDLMNQLQSHTAQQYVDGALQREYDESVKSAVSLAQEDIEHIVRHGKYTTGIQKPLGALNTSDAPKKVMPLSCTPTNKCSLSTNPNCQKLKDRFLMVQAGIVDKKNELKFALYKRETYCKTTDNEFSQQISSLERKIREQRTRLAVATQDQNTAESGSHQKSAQHKKMDTEYHSTMKTCCDNQNNHKSEICAMNKIRGELVKIAGQKIFITDCQVSDWREEECSATCGGGTMSKSRSIIVHKIGNGMKCPPLHEVVPCSEQPCPVDCVTSDWGGWSACGAECGGGVRERSRVVTVDMENGGTPCPSTEEAESCNAQSCDADCQLNDWVDWSSCSKPCNKGVQERTRSVLTPERGVGICPEPLTDQRRQFKPCNDFGCDQILGNRTILTCDSKVDLIILMDGSGSLREFGWKQTKNLSRTLVQNLEAGADKVKVAVELFSGPKTWADYSFCTGERSMPQGKTVDLAKQCGISWVSHFTDKLDQLDTNLENLAWPASSTLTSVALGEAKNEMMAGRGDANTVVVVITDGKPMSQLNTIQAAKSLSEAAKVIWVPVGRNAPIHLIKELAADPVSEHMVRVKSFSDLTDSGILNSIITNSCPQVA